MTPRRARAYADLALLLMVVAWAFTFVTIKDVTAEWPRHTMTFVALRFWIATAAFAPLLLRARMAGSGSSVGPGTLTGMTMLVGYGLQTAGLESTTPARAAFLTGLSVVLVPLGARLLGRRIAPAAVLGTALATVGLAVLSLRPETSYALGRGEAMVIGCAVAFTAQILLTENYAARVDPLRFTAVQCAVTALGATVLALWLEVGPLGWPQFHASVVGTAVFCGLVCTTLAFSVQTVAQRFTPATHVALIYATEPVFGAWASWWLLGEQFTGRMQLGCALIWCGMLCAELLPRLWRRAGRTQG